jgi:hypothetical protein
VLGEIALVCGVCSGAALMYESPRGHFATEETLIPVVFVWPPVFPCSGRVGTAVG